MMKLMKIVSMCLVLVLMLGCLASCAATPEKVLEQADKALTSGLYSVDIDISYSCDDPTLDAVFDSMENATIRLSRRGEDMLMEMSMTYMGYEMDNLSEILVVGNVMYNKAQASLLGKTETTKRKATLDAEDKASVLEEIASSASSGDVKPTDFGELSMEIKDGKTVITCTGLSEEAEDSLIAALQSSLGDSMEVDVSNVQLSCAIKDKKYDTLSMQCVYSITAGGETFEVEAAVVMAFDYETDAVIAVPSDADTYEEVTFDEMMGGGV